MVSEPDGYRALVAGGPTHAGLDAVHSNVLDVRSKLRTDEDVETDAHQLLVSDQSELLVPVQDFGQLGSPCLGIVGAAAEESNP